MSRAVDPRAPKPDPQRRVDGPASWWRDLLAARGGFTFHHHTGDQVADGLAVCADPAATERFPLDQWSDERVNAWVQRCVDRTCTIDLDAEPDEGGQADLHLGGWLDRGGWVWLDVVRVFPPHHHEAAVAFGRRRRQRAIFDLGRHEVVPLACEGAP